MRKRPTIHGVGKIYLMLGSACNFSCPHCLQHAHHPRIKKQVSPVVIDWLRNIAASRPEDKKPTVMFWGGEPLLYREAMHYVVEHLGTACAYSMVSNGGLLTDDDVEWLNNNDVSYVYSNDGKCTDKVRDTNLFEDEEFVERFNRIKRKGVCGVFHAHNQDLYQFWDYVRSKSPTANIFIEPLVCTPNVPRSYAAFDYGELDKLYTRMEQDFAAAVLSGSFKRNDAYNFLEHRIFRLKHTIGDHMVPICGSGRGALNIDTAGKVYPCHNCSEVIGTIADSFDELYERTEEYFDKKLKAIVRARGCDTCEAFSFCGGGCPFEDPEQKQPGTCELKRMEFKTAVACIQAFKNYLEKTDNA